jgi:hypothetical protein
MIGSQSMSSRKKNCGTLQTGFSALHRFALCGAWVFNTACGPTGQLQSCAAMSKCFLAWRAAAVRERLSNQTGERSMPRPRRPENRGLPSRWRFDHGAYYYQVPIGAEGAWDGKRTFRLGKTLRRPTGPGQIESVTLTGRAPLALC